MIGKFVFVYIPDLQYLKKLLFARQGFLPIGQNESRYDVVFILKLGLHLVFMWVYTQHKAWITLLREVKSDHAAAR